MYFILGFICGVLISNLIVLMLIYFRCRLEQKITVIETKVQSAGPHPKGSVIIPEDESTEIRNEIINKNREKGLDTPVSDLR